VAATLEDSARLDWFLNGFGDGLLRMKKTAVGRVRRGRHAGGREAPGSTGRRDRE
jgi:hypothetical protein